MTALMEKVSAQFAPFSHKKPVAIAARMRQTLTECQQERQEEKHDRTAGSAAGMIWMAGHFEAPPAGCSDARHD